MLKFDTRNKKPTLYNIAAISALTAIILGFLLKAGAASHAVAVSLVLTIYFTTVLIILIAAWFGQIEYNPYSYNTIYYLGFALFLLFVLVTRIYITVRLVRDPEAYGAHEVLFTLLNASKSYLFLTFPFLFVFSVALCISNISLIRHEGRRFVNVLGIILSFLLVAGALCLYSFYKYIAGREAQHILLNLCANLFAAVYLYFECMLIGAIVADLIAALHEPEPDKDFLIILGCGIRKDGTPSPLLRGRVDRALDFYRKQKAATGKELIFIPSGGQGPDEVTSESAAMKAYLMEQGIPEEQIIMEDKSGSTFENMKFSKEKIWAVNPDGKVAFATTNYHVFRGGLYARRVKMRAVGMGSKTRWYFWPNASVREFVGLLTEHRGKQILIFGGMILIYTILTVMAYGR